MPKPAKSSVESAVRGAKNVAAATGAQDALAKVPLAPSAQLQQVLSAQPQFVPEVLQIDQTSDPCPGYRFWPVEPMLAEANGLVEKCLETMRRLDALWKEEAGLQLQEALDASDCQASSLEEAHYLETAGGAKSQAGFADGVLVSDTYIDAATLAGFDNVTLNGVPAKLVALVQPYAMIDGRAENKSAAMANRVVAFGAVSQALQLKLQQVQRTRV